MVLSLALLLTLVASISTVTSSPTKYVAELRIYVDKSGFEKWKRVTGKSTPTEFWREMNSTVFEINKIYKTLEKYNLDIQLQIQDIVMLDHEIVTSYEGKQVHAEALGQFESWIKFSARHYDLAILFTGVNLVRTNFADTTFGYAYIAQICTRKALGVLEIKGIYYDALAAAHEIGHIFGSIHDGDCDPNLNKKGFIMDALTLPAARNHFYFSYCSAKSIKSTINKINQAGNNCMKTWDSSSDIKGPEYATLLKSPDQLCQRAFGADSYIARKTYGAYGNAVCSRVACMIKDVTDFKWDYTPTPTGFDCGKNRQCVQGSCVSSTNGSDQISDYCPFGDQPKIGGTIKSTCPKLAASGRCNKYLRTSCCQTCDSDEVNPGTADDVCESLQGPGSYMARGAYTSDTYGHLLCSRLSCLSSVFMKRFWWKYYTAPDGMNCGKNKQCKEGECVYSPKGDPNMSDSCPYGDLPWLAGNYQATCKHQVQSYSCNGWQNICCASCAS